MPTFITDHRPGPIGIFDSGYGGLTILEKIREVLPQYDYIYLGDNARAPYGTRSFEVVYEFTRQAVLKLFSMGCRLVILACNTASAKALRSIQQLDLPMVAPDRRVLGIIRPTAEAVGAITQTSQIGVLATVGTIQSCSYTLEIRKLYPHIQVFGKACPMWVPLVENREYDSPGADYFIEKDVAGLMAQAGNIDTVILACTHYPLLLDKIRRYLPEGVVPLTQGNIVAESLKDYLIRHPEMEERCQRGGDCTFYTTESPEKFSTLASIFLQEKVTVTRLTLE